MTVPPHVQPAATLRSRGWVLKRIALSLVLIVTFALGSAVLLHATIEPDQSVATGE